MDPDAAVEEYNDLFVGVGKSAVNLHASHCLTGFMMEKPLVEVRATLDRLGLARRAGVSLLEDHLAALCETMRILIAGQGRTRAGDDCRAARIFRAAYRTMGSRYAALQYSIVLLPTTIGK